MDKGRAQPGTYGVQIGIITYREGDQPGQWIQTACIYVLSPEAAEANAKTLHQLAAEARSRSTP